MLLEASYLQQGYIIIHIGKQIEVEIGNQTKLPVNCSIKN